MIYLLLDSTDNKTIKSVSSGEFKDLPQEYTQVEIKTENEQGEDLENIPEGFFNDYSLFEWNDKIILK